MLIVNADDLGAASSATDAILETWEAGAVTSASAMVWMPDSERAAKLVAGVGLPTGLHLNLTLELGDANASAAVRERQIRMTRAFSADGWRSGQEPAVSNRELRDAIEDQLACYRKLYGEPTHINGHHHVHVNPAVLRLLPRDVPIRPIMRAPSQARGRPSSRDRDIAKRFRTTRIAIGFEYLHPSLGGEGFHLLEETAVAGPIEVLTHPQQRRERAALLSAEWLEFLASRPRGSYRDLPADAW